MDSIFKLGVIVSALDRLSGPMQKMSKAVTRFQDRAAKMRDAGLKFQAAGFFMSAQAAKMRSALGSVIRPAIELEKGLAEVATLLPTLKIPELKKMGADFLKFLAKSPFVARDAIKGLYDTISAGISKPAAAIRFLGLAQRAAVAGVTDLATSVDLGTTILNAYKMETSEATRVFDVLQTTVRLGKTTMTEMGASLGNVASIAATANVPIETVGAAIATMTAAGVKTPEVMTAMTGFLKGLAAPASQAGRQLAALGGQTLQTAIEAGDLEKVLGILSAKKLTFKELTKLFPRIEAAKAAAVLLKGYEGFADNLKQTRKPAGEVDRAFKKMSATFDFQWKVLKNKVFVALEQLGRELLPTLKWAIEGLIPIIKGFGEFAKRRPGLVKFGLAIAAIGTAALTVAAPLVSLLGALTMFTGAAINGAIKTLGLFAGAIKGVRTAMLALTAHPIIALLTVIIAGFAIAGKAIIDNWWLVKQNFMDLGAFFSDIKGAGKAFVEAFWEGISAAWGTMKDKFGKLIGWMRDMLPGSDAKLGPLADLSRAGQMLPLTFAEGMRKTLDMIPRTLAGGFEPMNMQLAAAGAEFAPAVSPAAIAGRPPVQFNNTFNFNGGFAGKNDTDEIRRQFEQMFIELERSLG